MCKFEEENNKLKSENMRLKKEKEELIYNLGRAELEKYKLEKELQKVKNKTLADVEITLISCK